MACLILSVLLRLKGVAVVSLELKLCAELGRDLCLGSMAGSCGKATTQNSP